MDVVGAGTLLNTATIVLGALLGLLVGGRLPERTRRVVTDALGLVVILVAALSAAEVVSPVVTDALGTSAPVLIVMGSLLVGALVGTALGIESRLAALAGVVQRRVGREGRSHASRERFIEGWLTATLLFCTGPLTVLGSLDDGLGRGIDKLALKSVMDGFAALAFASTFGIGVLFSAVSVLVVQGTITVLGLLLGEILPEVHVLMLSATGGLVLVGIALRLMQIRDVAVGDLLPALVVAPLLTQLVLTLG
ncbi:DUF554 domain-containing protein [Janibacter alkaliphilus]|uniref:DUF554 domain-containing protein n=1 Tax=Janibacter alkaliphilus TaxID=1069963 RepID=A0A852X744_9MICO|nr:DUF554 domain-containing protein [Janibacter alkaliphilus]NYG38248.1 hypothetical protein [Janibacter alkaliphilus]